MVTGSGAGCPYTLAMLDPPAVRRGKRLRLLGMVTLAALVGVPLSMFGLSEDAAILGPLSMAHITLTAGLLAAAYLFAGVGFALALLRWVAPESRDRPWLALALGPGLMLWLSHLLGVAGLLSGSKGRWVAAVVLASGLLLLGLRLVAALREKPNLRPPPWLGLLWPLAFAVTFVAASHPPGVLWRSEAGGYDSLSYHLPLAQEWATGPRLWPLEHNVYSFLPSYVEAGFLHLNALLGGGEPVPADRVVPVGLIAGDGLGAIACHWLSALMSFFSALVLARFVSAVLSSATNTEAPRRGAEAGALAGAALLATPWVVVVSSLAYTESAVNLMFAGALLAAVDGRLAPAIRGTLIGLLVGAACGAKPTALFLIGPTAGLALLAFTPKAKWLWAVLAGAAAGLLMIAPFLVRNWLAVGNPVFPAGTGLFGPGWWSAEQIARFSAAHSQTGSFVDRLGLLLATTGDGLGGEPRGIFHSQWSVLFPAGLIALGLAVFDRRVRVWAIIFAVGMAAAVLWWLVGSHGQSRFLLPLAVPLAGGLGLAASAAWSWPDRAALWRRLTTIALAALPLFLAALAVSMLRSEIARQGYSLLPEGTGPLTGDRLRYSEAFQAADELARRDILADVNPNAFINLGGGGLEPGATLYLLGDATPFYFARRTVYTTTWDSSLLARAIEQSPDDPQAWGKILASRGVQYVLVNLAELQRLYASGWLDPRLTEERITRFIRSNLRPIRAWDSGQALFKLDAAPALGERPA